MRAGRGGRLPGWTHAPTPNIDLVGRFCLSPGWWGCYKHDMATRELCGRGAIDRLVALSQERGRLCLVCALALLPVLAGCSGSSFGGPGASQMAAAPPPSPAAPAVNAALPQPVPAQPPEAYAGVYPSVSLVDLFKGDAASSMQPAQAANMPHPPSTYTPSGQPYVPAANQAYVPHPPGSYTPSGQPYPPPAGQQPYGTAGPPAAAAPPPPSNEETVGGVYPQQSLFDIFTNKSQ